MFAFRSPVGPIRPFLLVFAAALLLAVPAGAHASAVPDHITVSVSPAKVPLGQPVTVTATVKAADNATISDYSGPADLQDNAGALEASLWADRPSSATIATPLAALNARILTAPESPARAWATTMAWSFSISPEKHVSISSTFCNAGMPSRRFSNS